MKSKATSHTRINQICDYRNKKTQYVHVICFAKQQRNMNYRVEYNNFICISEHSAIALRI